MALALSIIHEIQILLQALSSESVTIHVVLVYKKSFLYVTDFFF